MEGKRERLRRGETVELSPGERGWLNFENQTLQLADGTALPISDDDKRHLFHKNEEEKKYSQKKESYQKGIKEFPLGLGEFAHQALESGVGSGIQDWIQKFTQTGDDYLNSKRARQEISQEISEESPYISMAGTAASFIPDLVLTRGMSAAKAAPLLTAASAGPRIIEEPGSVAKDALIAAGGGYLLDKATAGLGKVAQRRGQIRNLPGEIENVQAQNRLGAQATQEANALERQNFLITRDTINKQNQDLIVKHESDLLARKNSMIESKNAYETAKIESQNAFGAAKEVAKQEEKLLSDQYNLAQKEYNQSLKNMPAIQKKAQQEYSQNVIKNVEQIQKSFPKDSKIYSSQLGADEFINNSINKTGLAASKEASQATRIIKSLFPEGEALTSKEFSSRYKAIEDAIQRSTPEVKQVLTEFKNHLGERLPLILEDTITYQKVVPLLKRYLEKDVIDTLKTVPGLSKKTIATIRHNSYSTVRGIDSNNFVQRLQSGELSKKIVEDMAPIESFINFLSKEDIALLKSGKAAKGAKSSANYFESVIKGAEEKRQAFINGLSQQLDNRMARYEIKAMDAAKAANKKMGGSVKGTYGVAEPIPEPTAPPAPQPVVSPLPPPQIAPPPELPLPPKPVLAPTPQSPTPQQFSPAMEPTLPPAQGMAEKLGNVLEKPMNLKQNLLSPTMNNPIAKLAGLKYALGPAAVPAEIAGLGAYAGLKGLTSPTAAGELARLSFKQAGIAAIEQMAEKYPSYNDGILNSPMDRRSLTREIEDDPEIPPSQKALLQSKVNRGKRLGERLN